MKKLVDTIHDCTKDVDGFCQGCEELEATQNLEKSMAQVETYLAIVRAIKNASYHPTYLPLNEVVDAISAGLHRDEVGIHMLATKLLIESQRLRAK